MVESGVPAMLSSLFTHWSHLISGSGTQLLSSAVISPVYVTDNSSILFNTLNSFGLKDSVVASVLSSALRRLLSYKFEIREDEKNPILSREWVISNFLQMDNTYHEQILDFLDKWLQKDFVID